MKVLLSSLLTVALVGCASQGGYANDDPATRAAKLQMLQSMQQQNNAAYQQQLQTIQAARPARPVNTTCQRMGDQIYCTSN